MFDKVKGRLGLGCMRLQMIEDEVDKAEFCRMIDMFIEAGFNYFDTAHTYIDGKSELVIRDCLTSRYPREAFVLADKISYWCFEKEEEILPLFERQLERCGVEYFDFYLLHNVYENSINTYTDPKWGIIDYFVQQKREGRIKHLGFSTHSEAGFLEKVV